ncbi:MAG: SDR family oxidoreductase [Nitrosomonadales bacterium]|nr:SDR family oxidoreductase [Nitrosomonadales bacterium]
MTIGDKVVVITGAGSGLGRALAVGLVRRGATVVGLGSREPPLRETSELIGDGRFSWHVVDVSEAEKVTGTINLVADAFGRIDVLVNNAAIYPKISFLEQDAESWMRAIAVNLGGAANCCRAALPHMMRRGSGRIINVGSYADLSPIPNSSAYAASKGGLHALTKAIAADLGNAYPDIICAEWMPGPMKTRMGDPGGTDPSVCAEWALRIIEQPRGGRKVIIFEKDREHTPPKSLKSRVKEKLMFWRR